MMKKFAFITLLFAVIACSDPLTIEKPRNSATENLVKKTKIELLSPKKTMPPVNDLVNGVLGDTILVKRDSLIAYFNIANDSLNRYCQKNYIDSLAIKNIIIGGHMDARDFSTIKWAFKKVENIDIHKAIIDAYSGIDGPNEGNERAYSENVIPCASFFYCEWHEFRPFPAELYDEGMASVKNVILPSGLVGIDTHVFARNYNLENIVIPEGLIFIDYVAFRHCHSLKVLNLPSSLRQIGLWAFTNLDLLSEVHCRAVNPPSLEASFGELIETNERGWVYINGYTPQTTATLYVPIGSAELYRNSDWGMSFMNIIEE